MKWDPILTGTLYVCSVRKTSKRVGLKILTLEGNILLTRAGQDQSDNTAQGEVDVTIRIVNISLPVPYRQSK